METPPSFPLLHGHRPRTEKAPSAIASPTSLPHALENRIPRGPGWGRQDPRTWTSRGRPGNSHSPGTGRRNPVKSCFVALPGRGGIRRRKPGIPRRGSRAGRSGSPSPILSYLSGVQPKTTDWRQVGSEAGGLAKTSTETRDPGWSGDRLSRSLGNLPHCHGTPGRIRSVRWRGRALPKGRVPPSLRSHRALSGRVGLQEW